MTTLHVPQRFNGPPRSGNGGWVSGALAAALPDASVGRAVTVTLRLPPPLEVDLPVTVADDGTAAVADAEGRAVATAAPAAAEPVPVPPVPLTAARAGEAAYRGHVAHPFAGCFVCGPARAEGDGLRIFAGPVPGAAPGHVAATWTPTESTVPITWAALDCPGGWSTDLEGRPSVLGRITALVHRLPRVGEEHVVVGEERQVDGRKTLTAATLYAGDEVVATAEHVWIAIDPEDFR